MGLFEVKLRALQDAEAVQVLARAEWKPLLGRKGIGSSRCGLEILKGKSLERKL